MPDVVHEEVDKKIKALENKLKRDYERAGRECRRKLNAHLKRFEAKDKQKLKQLKRGEISKDEYDKWRYGQMMTGQRWQDMCDRLAEDLADTSRIARETIANEMPGVYAENINYSTFQVEKMTGLDTSFTLYDENTVRRIWKDNPQLMPDPADPDNELTAKEKRWYKKHINSAVMQGILQGESIPKIAKRMDVATGIGYRAAVRTARTSMTCAQNAGRLESYKRANDIGIPCRQMWLATLDGRTRHSHRALDGEVVDVGQEFSNECKYPGDPDCENPAEIYNCRCTTIAQIAGFEHEIDYQNSEEYLAWKGTKPVMPKQNGVLGKPLEHSEDDEYNELYEALKKQKVEYNEVKMLDHVESDDEIIDKIAGGDMTNGSCASLALCYIARKNGMDVIDFRGGKSQFFFSYQANLIRISEMKGRKVIKGKGKSPATVANDMLKQAEEGKIYYLCAGRHAAIVRKKDGVLQYLELQSPTDNGWKDFGSSPRKKLTSRFRCSSSSDYGRQAEMFDFMIDIDESDFATEEFQSLMGFINTDPDKQKKGVRGGLR